jgi:hypothetical protein
MIRTIREKKSAITFLFDQTIKRVEERKVELTWTKTSGRERNACAQGNSHLHIS